MTEVITEKARWTEVIDTFAESDFYHTFDYHMVSMSKEEKPVLFVYCEDGLKVALPLLIRKIPGHDYNDATSVYGYPGPLVSSVWPDFDHSNFLLALNAFFEKQLIVSVFSRFNPFIPKQEYLLEGLGEVVCPGNVINIDLTKGLDAQRQQYHKRLRTYINKSRRNYTIRQGSASADIDLFIALYHDNMRRVDAKPKYFFDSKYFYSLLASNAFEAELLMADDNRTGQTIAGAMFIKKNRIVQYHLSGVREDFLKLNPIKLLIDEMRIQATEEGYTYFNLGGGVANKEDSLYHFKRSFSHNEHPFNVWRYIVNRRIYDMLVKEKEAEIGLCSSHICSDFFPCYRCEHPVFHK